MKSENIVSGFDTKALEPFGMELTSQKLRVDVPDLMTHEPDRMSSLLHEHMVLVFRNTVPFDQRRCNHIAGPETGGSTKMFHADQRGTVDALVWQVTGPSRANTEFVCGADLKQVSLENVPMLESLLHEPRRQGLVNALADTVAQAFERPSDFQPNDLHTVFRRLVIDRKLRASMPQADRGLGNRICRMFTMQKTIRREVECTLKDDQIDRVFSLMSAYSDRVSASLHDRVYVHDWKKKPDSVVIAANAIPFDGDISGTAFHRGVPQVEPSDDTLLRMQFHDGVVGPTPAHGF